MQNSKFLPSVEMTSLMNEVFLRFLVAAREQ